MEVSGVWCSMYSAHEGYYRAQLHIPHQTHHCRDGVRSVGVGLGGAGGGADTTMAGGGAGGARDGSSWRG